MASSLHVVLFPFMAKGHTIPVLQLARLFLRRNATVTLFTTPANHPFVSATLSDTPTTIISLPFPQNIPGVPSGVESTDKLPSMSLFLPFVSSTKLIEPHFEQALQSLQTPVTFMVTDGFFGWTLDSANKFNIPRLVYYGMSNFSVTLSALISNNPNLFDGKSDTDQVTVPEFPWMKVARIDFGDGFNRNNDSKNPLAEWVMEQILATRKSYGLVTNSFFELEPVYTDFWNSNFPPKSWCVGPFCFSQEMVEPNTLSAQKPSWMVWLDEKLQLGSPVLYVAFGSQAEISMEQIEEIKIGLERSEVNFFWVVRGNKSTFDDGFEERVKGRGIVVREWVNQREILKHESVKGFVSHCGWNSVLESICAAVPIVAWPLMAEQPLNAKFVVEEMEIGSRVETCDGSLNGFVKWEELEKRVRELMEGEKGKEMRKKVEEISQAAMKAVEDGGSSCRNMNELIEELQAKQLIISE
ncbi:UDP-glycosyltransferase 90A1-like [Cynara cardunculus var. scolymus]|uniref:Glycosyltransferase n=1 Tax=Cynara cardunculus var. scolymus TaxID=59895 RepID=A0A118K5J1_CYNCS|nr:UDP-glycosyltransferase 90A1-like [Cynara cardunculus var. scolymus]KVI09181.1 UDP-glucuronosyl/UDP-glucosyltransferase [Cynara cardunculus var. scolymus]